METADTDTVDEAESAEATSTDDAPTFFERILPDSALARWGVYLVIIAIVAAILWFWVFPPLQNLLPAGF